MECQNCHIHVGCGCQLTNGLCKKCIELLKESTKNVNSPNN